MPRRSYALSKPRDFSVIDAGTGKAVPGAAIPVVCERIRHYRMKIGMGRMAFASAVQVSGNAVSNWETGRTRPDISLIPAICEALGISPCQLFEMQDPGKDYSEEEQQLVSLYRGLSAGNRRALRLLAGNLKDAQLGDACPDITVLRFMEKGLAAGTGDPSEFEEHGRPIYLYTSPLISRADYVFPVSGDSMEPEYRNGDLVLVQAIPEGPELQHGETGAFIKGNEQFIKVYEEKGLRSLNPNYPFMNFSDTDETV
ncbi:MAG: helix-turn-helix domain-containing protein, partial [Oscillospiraceae bacterium]|nr:helix-turn-helix domain-containing protein [Oscillospiraceae bacterium]